MREFCFDVETTGFSPSADRIVSVAAVELVDFMPTGRAVHFYVNPGQPSSPGAFAVHGLSEAFLSTKPPFREIADSLLSFLGGRPLVAHNSGFDRGFLNAELMRAGRLEYPGGWLCTKLLAGVTFGRRAGNRLDDLVKRFGIRDLRAETGAHGALIDAVLLVQVYRALHSLPPVLHSVFGPILGQVHESVGVTRGEPVAAAEGCAPVAEPAGESGAGAGAGPSGDPCVHNATETRGPEPAGPAPGAAAACSGGVTP